MAKVIFFLCLAVFALIQILNRFAAKFPLPLQKTIRWLHSMVFEMVAVAITFLLRPIGYFSRTKEPYCKASGRPILLVHGYLHDCSAWFFLRKELCRKGFGPVYTLNLFHPLHSICDHAALVAKKAAEIAEQTKRDDLCLIGHSMGGLVSAWYALEIAKPGTVTDVITIGSPLHGTHAATVALGQNGREMRCGSEFLCRLQNIMQKNVRNVRFYHIASKTDQLILPWISAITGKFPEREYVIEDIGHMSLLFSSRISKQIQTWLRSCLRVNG